MKKYKPIIDDWKAFKKACRRPAVRTIRRNRIKARESFEEELKDEFEDVEQSSWNSDLYRLKETELPGKTLMHWMGEYYVQEESAALPVEALNPQEGEKILDMCAAPGGKTTQIASNMENRGDIIANDSSGKRLQSLHANVYRTGSASITVTNYDGRQIPEDEKFDRILVDAPCSGEGDRCRRDFKEASEKDIEGLADLQKQLMDKASNLLKEKGTLVYSTCTITPRENEAVVKKTLEQTELDLEKIKTDAPHQRGVQEFQNRIFGEEINKTLRIYPHHLDSGVIFVARFRK